ncbi:MAG: Rrf2 family transcriptional regulator [Deltaproteobacteria bacterium]|nr:Rrf2 family transcriptional regulator [Deltaproteobacteria bacterium]
MLSISSKCKYGITAVLALAENYGNGLMQIKEIASIKHIPHQYLGQIFNLLVNAGTIKSVRGKKGGYELAFEPSEITILNLIEILEGGVQLTSEICDPANAVDSIFQSTENKLKDYLKINLSEIILMQQEKNKHMMFHI